MRVSLLLYEDTHSRSAIVHRERETLASQRSRESRDKISARRASRKRLERVRPPARESAVRPRTARTRARTPRRTEPSAARTRRLSLAQRELAPVHSCATLAELLGALGVRSSTSRPGPLHFSNTNFDFLKAKGLKERKQTTQGRDGRTVGEGAKNDGPRIFLFPLCSRASTAPRRV